VVGTLGFGIHPWLVGVVARAVHDDLRASYIVVDHQRHGYLEGYLRSDPRFALAFDDGTIAIYAVGEGPPSSEASADAAGSESLAVR